MSRQALNDDDWDDEASDDFDSRVEDSGDSGIEESRVEDSGIEGEEDLTIACPYCGEDVYEDSPRCPHCENYLSVEERTSSSSSMPVWVIVGLVLALLATSTWFFLF